MDWPSVSQPLITDDDIDHFFDYDFGLLIDPDYCRAVHKYDSQDFQSQDLSTNEQWDQWVNTTQPSNSGSLKKPGFSLLLLSPVELEIAGIPSPHYYLPLAKPHWKKITESFCLHEAICKGIEDNKAYSGFLVKRGILPHDPAETLEMFTAIMDSTHRPQSISFSSTYFTKSKTSCGVLFNCDSDQKDLVCRLLEASPEVSNHPFLVLGLYAELQRDRMQKLVMGVQTIRDITMACLRMDRAQTSSASIITWQLSNQLRQGIARAKEAEEIINDTKRHFEKITKYVAKSSKASKQPEFFEATSRYQDRFEEIMIELDSLVAACRIVAEDLTFTGDLFMVEMSRQSLQAARQAKNSTAVAFVAMLYLPMTSVATIFAMPAFQFQNRWWNMAFKDRPSSSTTSPSDDNNGSDNFPGSPGEVVSGYLTIYLVLSTVLTGLTIAFYFCYTREKPEPPPVHVSQVEDKRVYNIRGVRGKSRDSSLRSVSRKTRRRTRRSARNGTVPSE
ncbi:hypothetical protein QBC44DRAFT_319284 [Cladorrhinum sp. PSN332]|nr:hypothetical protein QBC44DRAFT_319284 [Cladorrhinum sp. PSN332]